jgi:hypothetical protein
MVATEVGDTKHWAKRGGAIAVFLVVCGLTLGAVKVVTISRNVFEQERCLHAMILAARVVEDYVTNFDQWPRSWDDLKKVLPQDWGPYGWPGDSDDIATLVNIDFDYDLGQIEPVRYQISTHSAQSGSAMSYTVTTPYIPCGNF